MTRDSEEPAYQLAQGDVYEGFTVLRRIGCGGFGQVYLVRDASGRRWALKLFVPAEAKDRAAVTRNRTAAHRFLMEAAILQSIKNMHVVRCERHGQAADGSLWLLLEYLPGNSLRRELETCELGRMPMERVLRIGYQIASALFVIHGRGVVHRDIKPENVMILPGDVAKVLDFGVAKAQGASASFRTTGAVHYGTGLYMAPDRLMSMGGEASPLWDIYSAGLTLWEMADGQHPFFRAAGSRLTDAQVIHMHMGGRSIPSLSKVTGHDAEVCEAVMRACAPDPRDRFQSAEEMMSAIEDALARERQISTDRIDPLGQNVTGRTRARITAAITEPSLSPAPAAGLGPREARGASRGAEPVTAANSAGATGAAVEPAAAIVPRWTKTEPITSHGPGRTERIVTPPALARPPAPGTPAREGLPSRGRDGGARGGPASMPRVAPVPAAHVLRELGRPDLTEEERAAVTGLHPAEQRYRILFLRYLDTLPADAAIDMDRIGSAVADHVEEQMRVDAGHAEEAQGRGDEVQADARTREAEKDASGSGRASPFAGLARGIRAIDDRSRELFARVPAWGAITLLVLSLGALTFVLWWRSRGSTEPAREAPVTVAVEAPVPWAPPSVPAPAEPSAPTGEPAAAVGPASALPAASAASSAAVLASAASSWRPATPAHGSGSKPGAGTKAWIPPPKSTRADDIVDDWEPLPPSKKK